MKVGMRDDMHRMDEAAESVYGLPAVVLMENAGRKTARRLRPLPQYLPSLSPGWVSWRASARPPCAACHC